MNWKQGLRQAGVSAALGGGATIWRRNAIGQTVFAQCFPHLSEDEISHFLSTQNNEPNGSFEPHPVPTD